MRPVGTVVILGLLASAWAQGLQRIRKPDCDSLEAEEAALVAQEYINAQHSHGYKYALNQIEEIKIITKPDGGETYVVELELLETKCHALDPTPVANCTVRPRHETKVEADCDVVLSKAGGILTVVAYKCKSEPDSAEDVCLLMPICSQLVPLNHTDALQVVSASLAAFNSKLNNNTAQFALLEVGRLSKKRALSGDFQYFVEYAIVETNCPVDEDGCVPVPQPLGRKGFCVAIGVPFAITVDCTLFPAVPSPVDPAANVTQPVAPKLQTIQGLKHHHRFSTVRDPAATGLLSSESAESAEVPIVKRQAPMDELLVLPVEPAAPEVPAVAEAPVVLLLPVCPGKKRHF